MSGLLDHGGINECRSTASTLKLFFVIPANYFVGWPGLGIALGSNVCTIFDSIEINMMMYQS